MSTVLPSALRHTAFFHFTPLSHPQQVVQRLRVLTSSLLGSILVAQEGINGVLAGTPQAVQAFEQAMASEFDAIFASMKFKHSACTTSPFGRMKVHLKSEIVAVGLEPSLTPPSRDKTTLLSPQAWRELIAQEDVLVLDNRNSFEYRVGHFANAVDPQVTHFSDFPRYVQDHAEQWRSEGQRIAMYCTGGIRCEKTSDWMQQLGLQIYQLEGGILNYFQVMPDAEKDWHGECFVFDNRIALDTKLQETATTAEDVYQNEPDGAWRLLRAQRLDPDFYITHQPNAV